MPSAMAIVTGTVNHRRPASHPPSVLQSLDDCRNIRVLRRRLRRRHRAVKPLADERRGRQAGLLPNPIAGRRSHLRRKRCRRTPAPCRRRETRRSPTPAAAPARGRDARVATASAGRRAHRAAPEIRRQARHHPRQHRRQWRSAGVTSAVSVKYVRAREPWTGWGYEIRNRTSSCSSSLASVA